MTLLLYLTISSIWIGMVFLSAAKGYRAIVGAFFIGTAISLGSSIFLGDRMGIEGLMAGYLLGQIVILHAFGAAASGGVRAAGQPWTGACLRPSRPTGPWGSPDFSSTPECGLTR
jgi:hypothetical protein